MKYVYSFLLCFCFTSFFAQNQSFKIGDKYKGGTVVYLFKEGDSQYGKYEGIILADTVIKDQKWGCEGTQGIALDKLSTSSKIGSSLSNHEMLLNNCKNGAASICNGLIIGNEKGWFLPTTEEINKIIENSSFLNKDIAPGKYWTNVDANINDAFILNIQNMGKIIYTLTTQKKYFPGIILPVKYFQKPVPVILKPEISFLNCTEAKPIGNLPIGCEISPNKNVYFKSVDQYVKDLIIKVPYKGGNGISYGSNVFLSNDATSNIQLNLLPGKLNIGDGELVFSLSGKTPNKATVNFSLNFGGQNGLITLNIKNNVWESKDLDVETFRNGDSLYRCYYLSDWYKAVKEKKPAYKEGYFGRKVYNWYAINDSRTLAPVGWHIATEEEWKHLIDCMGGSNSYDSTVLCNSLKKLKTEKDWYSNNNGNNISEFGALPTGEMNASGVSVNGDFGSWWSSSSCVKENVRYGISVFMGLNYSFYSECAAKTLSDMSPDTNILNTNSIGRTVRCVKD